MNHHLHQVTLLYMLWTLGMAEDDTYLHELARPSIRIVSDCYAASTDCAMAIDSLGTELKAVAHVDIICLTASIEGRIAKSANLLDRLERDRTKAAHYSWIRARVATYIFSSISTTSWQKGGGIFVCVGVGLGMVDRMCSSILLRHFKQRTGNGARLAEPDVPLGAARHIECFACGVQHSCTLMARRDRQSLPRKAINLSMSYQAVLLRAKLSQRSACR